MGLIFWEKPGKNTFLSGKKSSLFRNKNLEKKEKENPFVSTSHFGDMVFFLSNFQLKKKRKFTQIHIRKTWSSKKFLNALSKKPVLVWYLLFNMLASPGIRV